MSSKLQPKILYLYNPLANEGYSTKAWRQAHAKYPLLPKQAINILSMPDLQSYLTKHKPEIVAVAGGDGTLNKVAQAVLKLRSKPAIAILPLGLGNAISYCLGVDTLEGAITALQHPEDQIKIDCIKISSAEAPISILNTSIGFDALIVHYRTHDRYIGVRSYIMSGLRSILDHQNKDMTITIDHQLQLHTNTSSFMIANAPIIGKNYVVSETALLNDGYLDCTIFSSKYAYLSNLRLRGFKHPFYSSRGKTTFKAKHLLIEGEPRVQVDGDPFFYHGKLEFEIMPQALSFLYNKHATQHYEYLPYLDQ